MASKAHLLNTTDLSPRYVSYLRVSTDKQGEKGLGIAAQRETIRSYLEGINHGAQLIEEYVEVESGRKSDRPQLHKALSRCKTSGATLLIARLDRLSRNARFLLELQEAGVPFKACDAPYADNFTVGIMALVAQKEAESISKRTKEALGQIKLGIKTTKKGKTKLGNPNGAKAMLAKGKGNVAAVKAIKAKATEHAERLRGIIQDINATGITTLAGIAAKLNERHDRPPNDKRGDKRWHPNTVRRLIARVGMTLTFRVHKDSADSAIQEALARWRYPNPKVTRKVSGEFVDITITSYGDEANNTPSKSE